jgi:hypothetical protein
MRICPREQSHNDYQQAMETHVITSPQPCAYGHREHHSLKQKLWRKLQKVELLDMYSPSSIIN